MQWHKEETKCKGRREVNWIQNEIGENKSDPFAFSFYKQDVIFFQYQVALVITEVIFTFVFCGVGIGKEFKVKALFEESISVYPGFSISIQSLENWIVMFQRFVDFFNIAGSFWIQAIVVAIPTGIGAKLFICSAKKLYSTFEATFVFHLNKLVNDS